MAARPPSGSRPPVTATSRPDRPPRGATSSGKREPEPDSCSACGLRLTGPSRRRLSLAFETCAVRELNPGSSLGKAMSYHWTNGARRGVVSARAGRLRPTVGTNILARLNPCEVLCAGREPSVHRSVRPCSDTPWLPPWLYPDHLYISDDTVQWQNGAAWSGIDNVMWVVSGEQGKIRHLSVSTRTLLNRLRGVVTT